MSDATHPIYLDHNATTPLLPDVVEATRPYLREHFGNPSSGHVYGRRAMQSPVKIPVGVDDLGVDLLSIAGHKLYGPKGVGALYVRNGTPLEPVIRGAGHEGGLRPGTENVASIVGLGVACEIARNGLDEEANRLRRLRDLLWDRLHAAIPDLALNGHEQDRLPNTLNVRFPRTSGSAVLNGAPEIAASTGSACHEGAESASPVILAMGVSPREALGSVRLTLGRGTTEDEVARAAAALVRSWARREHRFLEGPYLN